MDDSKIVQVYSAANAIEAYAVANTLEAAGIKVKVAGDFLGMAAGGLPLGQSIAPSVWVLKEDETLARKLILESPAEDQNAIESSDTTEPETDDALSEEITETSEESDTASPAVWRRGFISPFLAVAGIACICIGIFQALENGIKLAHYSESVQAEYANYAYNYDTQKWIFGYEYQVNGAWHNAVIERVNYPGRYLTVRFNPQNPKDSYADQIVYPIWCLVISGILGGFALFLAYQFRS